MTKMCSKTTSWIFVLMLMVPGSVLFAEDPPPVQDQAVQATQRAAAAPVPPALHQALVRSLDEAASFGTKWIPTPPTGSWGIVSEGDGGGGIFRDSDHEAEAWLGTNGYGVEGFGSTAGGYFKDSNGSGYAYIGYGDYGIRAYGNTYGIRAYGNTMGGYFDDSNGTGSASLAIGDYGVVGEGAQGVRGLGGYAGGYFEDTNESGYAYVGIGDTGIRSWGEAFGGSFSDLDNSGNSIVGYGDYGIRSMGDTAGGYFLGTNTSSGYAWVGYFDHGIAAYGDYQGGYFQDLDSSALAHVAYSSYKISGTGTVSFIQNHPFDPSSVIVYAAPEGDEVATYTRGTAMLVDGEATVPLGETFKWVTNPDLGLTAYLTSVGEWCDLYIAEKATNQITVRSRDGADCTFDFLVYGLRIGFEELSIVQEKEHESYIPSMSDHRQLYERRPDLKSYNSLERFKGMHHAIDPKARVDLSQAHALRDAIIEFDPAVHELPGLPRPEEMNREDATPEIEEQREGVQDGERVRAARADQDRRLAPDHSALNAAVPVDEDGNVYATPFRPSSQDLASLVDVSEEVRPGDVLVIDRDNPGMMRKAFEAHDTGVIGVVAGPQPPPTEVIEEGAAPSHRAAVGVAGVVTCNVDAAYGAVWPGDLLVTSPNLGHAMRADAPIPGTTLGKALEPLKEGVGTIKVMVMLR